METETQVMKKSLYNDESYELSEFMRSDTQHSVLEGDNKPSKPLCAIKNMMIKSKNNHIF